VPVVLDIAESAGPPAVVDTVVSLVPVVAVILELVGLQVLEEAAVTQE
jgi:hypothetical protein